MFHAIGRKAALWPMAAMFGAALLTAPVFAQTTSPQSSPPGQTPMRDGQTHMRDGQTHMRDKVAPGSPAGAGAHRAERGRYTPERIEGRIKELQTNLKITPAQEPQWRAVADTMRDNARSMEQAAKAREGALKTMTVMDDLRSYEGLATTHADGLRKLVAAFGPLYDSMTPEQKRVADQEFQGYRKRTASNKK